jgi:hypothetical protein
MKEITFHKEGDYLIPNIVPLQEADEVRKWAKEWLEYTRRQSPAWANFLKGKGTLVKTALEVQAAAEAEEERLTEQLYKEYEVTNQLKNENPLEWVRRVKKVRTEVELVIMREIITSR